MNKAISKHFSKLGKVGGKKSWEARRKKILEQARESGQNKKNEKDLLSQ